MGQYADRNILIAVVIGVVGLDIISLSIYTMPWLFWPIIFILAGCYLIWALRDARALIIVPLAELAYCSFGHSIVHTTDGATVSLRMGILFLSMVVATIYAAKIRWNASLLRSHPFVLFALIVSVSVLASVTAILNHIPLGQLVADANAYGYTLYALIWFIAFRSIREPLKSVFSTLIAVATALAVKTILLFHVFSANYDWLNVPYLYLWLRDTRVAEITPAGSGLWRVFMQSQLYIGIVLIWMTQAATRSFWRRVCLSSVLIASMLVSQSRSYWVGLITVGALGVLWLLVRRSMNRLVSVSSVTIISAALGVGILCVAVYIPFGARPDLDAWSQRISTSDAAGVSRIQQLSPLMHAVSAHPFIGSGYGSTVTYRSSDPRIKTSWNPTGTVTTFAFEWGYLDMMLKWGSIGLALFVIFLGYLFVDLLKVRSYHTYAMASGLLFIVVTHIFSPYLNHPLGIGYLALVSVIVSNPTS